MNLLFKHNSCVVRAVVANCCSIIMASKNEFKAMARTGGKNCKARRVRCSIAVKNKMIRQRCKPKENSFERDIKFDAVVRVIEIYVEAPKIFFGFIRNCLNCKNYNCEDRKSVV